MSSGSPAGAPLGRASGRDRPPAPAGIARPTLGQLILWLTGCAIYFALARLFLRNPPTTPTEFLQLSGLAMFTSLCWTGMTIVLARLIRPSMERTIDPGAWLLCSLGVILTVDLLVAFLPDQLLLRVESLPMAASVLAFSLPTLSHMPRHWKAVYMLLTVLVAVPLVIVLVSRSVGAVPSPTLMARYDRAQWILVPLTLAVGVVMDRRFDIRRGGLHWLGVAATAAWLVR